MPRLQNMFPDGLLRTQLTYLCLLSLILKPHLQASAQTQDKSLILSLTPPFIQLEHKFVGKNGESIIIDKFQFYISFSKGEIPGEADYFLADLSEGSDTLRVRLEGEKNCFIGIDSLTQKDGAHEGALDPFNGMYWAWHSGYIQLKLEGKLLSGDGSTHEVILHAGGFSGSDNPLRKLNIQCTPSTKKIQVDLNPLINTISENKCYRMMSPGEQSNLIMKAFSQCFL